METSLAWIAITGYAMVQNFVFFFLFITQRAIKSPIKWILSFLSICCGLLLFEQFLKMTYGYERFPHMIFAMSPLWYLLSPLLYFYLRIQTKGGGLRWYDLLHLLPFIFVILSSLNFYSLSEEAKLHYLGIYGRGEFTAPEHNLNYIVFFLQTLGYTLVSWQFVKSTKLSSQIKGWHKTLLASLVVFSGLGLFAVFSANAGSQKLLSLNSSLFILWLSAFILSLFIRSTRNPSQLYFKPSLMKGGKDLEALIPTIQSIITHMESEKPYRDPNYNIHQMAHTLGYSKNHLAQAIKQNTNLNFRDFLNTYRIQEAKEKLAHPESRQYTIQSIVEEVGFKSSATFYRVFKKHEGITPTTFIKQG